MNLALAVNPEAHRLFSLRKADPAFAKFSNAVLQRDNYSCYFCQFQSKNFQQVVNLDQNYLNNKLHNLVTACCFCTQCCFLEAVGKDMLGNGILIYLPEITQQQLNGLCHNLFCFLYNNNNYRNEFEDIYRDLTARSEIIEQQLGSGMSNAANFGQIFANLTNAEQQLLRNKIFPALRLLPIYVDFISQIEVWSNEALNNFQ